VKVMKSMWSTTGRCDFSMQTPTGQKGLSHYIEKKHFIFSPLLSMERAGRRKSSADKLQQLKLFQQTGGIASKLLKIKAAADEVFLLIYHTKGNKRHCELTSCVLLFSLCGERKRSSSIMTARVHSQEGMGNCFLCLCGHYLSI
jgi:hypothetical protein